jgi:hypothetical protein
MDEYFVENGLYIIGCGGNGETSDLNYQWMLHKPCRLLLHR